MADNNVTTINIDRTLVPESGAKIHIVRSIVQVVFEDVVIENETSATGIRLILDKDTQAVLGRIPLEIQKQEDAEAHAADETESQPYYGESSQPIPEPSTKVAQPITFDEVVDPEDTSFDIGTPTVNPASSTLGISNSRLAERLAQKNPQ